MIFISSSDSHLSIMIIKITAYYRTRKGPVCRLAESSGDVYMLQDISFLIMRVTQHCLQEQHPHSRSLWITISTGFPSVSSVSSSLSFIPLTHPSNSDSAKLVGGKVIWLLLPWRPRFGGFYFTSPFFFWYCKAGRRVMGGRKEWETWRCVGG